MNTPAKKSTRRTPAAASGQRELAPATVEPAANDEARAAIVVINTQLSEFDKVEAGLADLVKRYDKIAYPVDTKKGMDEAVLARREIKGIRVDVEHAREAAKAPVLKLGREIDARANGIKTRLLAIETPIDDQIKAQERKEAERKADLERRITDVRTTPQKCIGKSVADLELVLEGLNTLPLAEFAEFRELAAKAQFDATQAVQTLLTQAKQAAELAELQAKQRKEEARKTAIQQAIDAIGAPLQQLPMCRTSARVQTLIDNVDAIEIAPAVYQEFAAAAREKKAAVLLQLITARDEKKAAEDARAAAAAAPAPTPSPTPAPTPAPEPTFLSGGRTEGEFVREEQGWKPSHHDRVNDEGAARLHREFGSVGERGPGRSLASDFARVMTGPVTAPHSEPEDPFTTPRRASSELSTSTPRPADAEILAVVADHYEVDVATAAAWLRTFDAASALAQQSLLPTT